MKAKLTSKGLVTIPISVCNRPRLKAGDVPRFDEDAPFLKATRVIDPEAWQAFQHGWIDPFPDQNSAVALDQTRGPVELPPAPAKQ